MFVCQYVFGTIHFEVSASQQSRPDLTLSLNELFSLKNLEVVSRFAHL